MSDCISIYPGLLSTWEAYPRVHYFRGRYTDLLTRFKRINRALPETLHDNQLMTYLEELNSCLANKYIHIIVIGKENLQSEELYVSKPETTDTNNVRQCACLTVIICHAVIDNLDEKGANVIMSVIQHAEGAIFQNSTEIADTILITCKINAAFSETECMSFRADIQKLVHNTIHAFRNKFDIIIVSESRDIRYHISLSYERRIIKAFVLIQSYLGLFVKGKNQSIQNARGVATDLVVRHKLRDFLCNWRAMTDLDKTEFVAQLVGRLARDVKCTIISPMSLKYVLPAWLCNRLLHEIEFEESLVKSVSANTKEYLVKFDKLYKSSQQKQPIKVVGYRQRSPSSKLSNYLYRSVLVDSIQKDFTFTISKVEKVLSSMESLTTVMRKMMFEIQGYLKQTLVHDANSLQTAPALKIPDSLRIEILAIQGVYGLGTIYGQLEIHVEEHSEARIAEMMERLKILTRKHHFLDSYTIKSIKQ
ncbi:uncharacterized protein LOC123549796 isoform X2 [Mercenaria mercenaria]|nr:uncharacterized protein LOC123549796 isoform X2 [Mercenaria mercenaria]XP_045194133.2 uncharacterized protein LOC123549796 isoform X2 [Mercenaria mercenaria]XP_045194136.2 uncharacterized protein LOC123549796 isoform X2 [Mercenaria mercenaria]